MSWKNLQLRKWSNATETRIYVNARYVDGRDAMANADGGYFVANEDGSLRWKHGFKTGPNTIRRAENVAFGMQAVIQFIGEISFDELINRLDVCKTKGGNFSATKYEKTYNL